jgi:hypothetical protein
LPPAERRALAADLEARYPSHHPARRTCGGGGMNLYDPSRVLPFKPELWFLPDGSSQRVSSCWGAPKVQIYEDERMGWVMEAVNTLIARPDIHVCATPEIGRHNGEPTGVGHPTSSSRSSISSARNSRQPSQRAKPHSTVWRRWSLPPAPILWRTRTMTQTQPGTLRLIGRGGQIAGYDVLIDTIRVFRDGAPQLTPFTVPNYGTSIHELSQRCGFRIGWARMEDEAEVLFFYDRDDDNVGFALNVSDPDCREWGYTPF